MRISDWSSDVCSSDPRHADLRGAQGFICDTGLIAGGNEPTFRRGGLRVGANDVQPEIGLCDRGLYGGPVGSSVRDGDPSRSLAAERSEEHTSELQSLMRIPYAVFCLQKKNNEFKQQ